MNLTDADLPLQSVFRHEKTRGDELAMVQPMGGGQTDSFTWRRTVGEARRMAAHLRSLGLPPRSQIAILSKNCAHFIMTDLAIWMAGHVSVALYPSVSARTVRYVLEHSETKLLFVGKLDSWSEQREGVPGGLACISYPLSPPNDFPTWNDLVAKTPPLEGEPARPADDLAIVVYTSGTTGNPKGAMHSFRTMAAAATGIIREYGIGGHERALSYLPLAHVFERCCIEMIGLLAGGQVYFVESLDSFMADLQRARPTVFISVPRLWLRFQLGVFEKMSEQKLKRLLRIPIVSRFIRRKVLAGLGLGGVRLANSGSAPMPAEVLQWYRDLGLELLEGYAMTENFSYSHGTRAGDVRAGYVGRPQPGVECRLSPEGEVLVKSAANMLGYFKEPGLTRDSFTEDAFLKTGDRGEIDERGRLRITGRIKELFKTSKGKYVAPAPIENLLHADSHVELACVAGSGREAAHAVVVLPEDLARRASQPEGRLEVQRALEALLAKVNGALEAHERLRFMAVVKDRWTIENGFLTPTLKVRRSEVEAAYAPLLPDWYGSSAKVLWQ